MALPNVSGGSCKISLEPKSGTRVRIGRAAVVNARARQYRTPRQGFPPRADVPCRAKSQKEQFLRNDSQHPDVAADSSWRQTDRGRESESADDTAAGCAVPEAMMRQGRSSRGISYRDGGTGTLRVIKDLSRFIGFNKISHENIRGKRAASGGAGLNVSVPAIISKRWSRWEDQEKPDKQGWRGGMHRHQ